MDMEKETLKHLAAMASMYSAVAPHAIYRNMHPIRREKKVGRNELCPCESGLKYKKCCIRTT